MKNCDNICTKIPIRIIAFKGLLISTCLKVRNKESKCILGLKKCIWLYSKATS